MNEESKGLCPQCGRLVRVVVVSGDTVAQFHRVANDVRAVPCVGSRRFVRPLIADTDKANAPIIAAAPDMLRALELLVSVVAQHMDTICPALADSELIRAATEAAAAIAKARGEAP